MGGTALSLTSKTMDLRNLVTPIDNLITNEQRPAVDALLDEVHGRAANIQELGAFCRRLRVILGERTFASFMMNLIMNVPRATNTPTGATTIETEQ